jgi:hypothetical protein
MGVGDQRQRKPADLPERALKLAWFPMSRVGMVERLGEPRWRLRRKIGKGGLERGAEHRTFNVQLSTFNSEAGSVHSLTDPFAAPFMGWFVTGTSHAT